MRILTFTSLFPNCERPEQGVFIFQRMNHLAQRPGMHIEVIAPVPYFPRWLRWKRWQKEGQVPDQEQIGSLTVHHTRYLLLPKISMPFHGLLMFLGSLRLALRLNRHSPFDCIDGHFVYPDGFAAVLLGKFLRLPVVVSARGTDINLYPSLKLIRPMIRWALRHSVGAIAVSSSLREVMLKFGLSQESVRVIGNGIDLDRFSPVDPALARAHLRMPEDAQVVVSVGGLVLRKAFHLLIQAVASIATRFPRLHLYIVGEGEDRSRLESLIRKWEVHRHVSLVGRVPNEQLRFWFSAAHVSCLVSSREGWANVLQESMACGTPVIATRVWGAPEIVVSRDLGLLVEQNSEAISAALESAITKDWNREGIAEHARLRTWQVVAAEVEQFLSSRIQAPRRSR